MVAEGIVKKKLKLKLTSSGAETRHVTDSLCGDLLF